MLQHPNQDINFRDADGNSILTNNAKTRKNIEIIGVARLLRPQDVQNRIKTSTEIEEKELMESIKDMNKKLDEICRDNAREDFKKLTWNDIYAALQNKETFRDCFRRFFTAYDCVFNKVHEIAPDQTKLGIFYYHNQQKEKF